MRVPTILLSFCFSAQAASAECGFMIREAQDGSMVIASEFAVGLSDAELRRIARGDYIVVSCNNGLEHTVEQRSTPDAVGQIRASDDGRFSSLDASCIQIADLYNSDRNPEDRIKLMECLGVESPTQTPCISEAMQLAEDQSQLAATRLFNCLSNEKAPMPIRPFRPLQPAVETTAGDDRSPPPG